jgi:hypothetical protein
MRVCSPAARTSDVPSQLTALYVVLIAGLLVIAVARSFCGQAALTVRTDGAALVHVILR